MTARWTIPANWPVQDRAAYLSIERFIPYDNNPRTHPPAQIALLASLLRAHGPDQPIVIDEDGIILKGHGRRMAAIEAGLTHFTFVRHAGLSDTEKRAIRIQDNQVALLSGWDASLIQGEITALKTLGYNILQLGFPEAQLRGFGVGVGTESEQDPDEVPEPPKAPIVRLGDLWVLGDHRVICGDCTDAETVKKVLGARKPNLMTTDPPYGVSYNPADRDAMTGRPTANSTRGSVANDDRADWTAAWNLFKGNVAYVWCASMYSDTVIANLENAGFVRRSHIIWAKMQLTFGRGDYHWQHEPCWYVVRAGKTSNWKGDRRQTTLWNDISNTRAGEDTSTTHGTQKPVECMKRPIENNSAVGDYVYEPFSGSGTTIIAAEMTGRKCLAIELDAGYVQVAIERWMKFSESVATLDGKPFDEVAKARRKANARSESGDRPSVRAPRPRARLPDAGVATRTRS